MAKKLLINFKIPKGLEFINTSTRNGKWTYNSQTRIVTWNMNKFDLKTKKLMITLKSLNSETYNILPTICADPTTNTKKQQH